MRRLTVLRFESTTGTKVCDTESEVSSVLMSMLLSAERRMISCRSACEGRLNSSVKSGGPSLAHTSSVGDMSVECSLPLTSR